MIALSENPKSRKGGPAVGDNDFMLQIVVFVKKKSRYFISMRRGHIKYIDEFVAFTGGFSN